MKPYQARVVQEKKELDERIEKLEAFIDSDACEALPRSEQTRLGGQLFAMNMYSRVLADRIDHFGS